MSAAVFFAVIFACIQGASPFRWVQSPQDGSLVYACTGDTITFNWDYVLGQGELIEDVQWFYNGRSNEMIAVLTHGNFLALPAFANRAAFVDNAGITISQINISDQGNYSVEVSGRDSSGAFFKESTTVRLQVGADLMTSDGELHVDENPAAVLKDPDTNEWAIGLRCGAFTYLGLPPFDVEWITPAGSVLNSTSFENGKYNLLLTSPIQGGNYTCRVPTSAINTACLQGSTSNKGEASYILDQVASRLNLLEAHQNSLQEENNRIKADNEKLKSNNTALANRLRVIEDESTQQISFHAHNLRNTQPQRDAPLVVEDVVLNRGSCYSSTTGKFTTPFNGTYFFIGTSGSWVAGQSGQFGLAVDGTDISIVSTQSGGTMPASSVHGVAHLTQGQQVWLRVSAGIEFSSAVTSFSGFLIRADP